MHYLELLHRSLNATALTLVSDETIKEIKNMVAAGAKPLRIYCHYVRLFSDQGGPEAAREMSGIEAHLVHSYGLDRDVLERFGSEIRAFNSLPKKGDVSDGPETNRDSSGDQLGSRGCRSEHNGQATSLPIQSCSRPDEAA